MAKKSNAKIRRMQQRAAARGEVYEPPPASPEEEMVPEGDKADRGAKNLETSNSTAESSKHERQKLAAARKLQKDLAMIEQKEDMKAKERRSAKRKAEAIASEATGMDAPDLIAWFKKQDSDDASNPRNKEEVSKRKQTIPYILFIGQLSYSTTREALMEHFKTEIGSEFEINDKTAKIRLLTDPKTKQSRGMAFVEVDTPELMYACLKLHRTQLDSRRINVERSAGGGKNSENRKQKIQSYRAQQEEYMESLVQKLVGEYKARGEIREGELDDGVIALCRRHSGAVVEAALERYVESNGRDMDNPSAYLSFLMGKLADEGIFESERDAKLPRKTSGIRPKKKQRV